MCPTASGWPKTALLRPCGRFGVVSKPDSDQAKVLEIVQWASHFGDRGPYLASLGALGCVQGHAEPPRANRGS